MPPVTTVAKAISLTNEIQSAANNVQKSAALPTSADSFTPSLVSAKQDLIGFLMAASKAGEFYCDLTPASPASNFEVSYQRALLFLRSPRAQSLEINAQQLRQKFAAYQNALAGGNPTPTAPAKLAPTLKQAVIIELHPKTIESAQQALPVTPSQVAPVPTQKELGLGTSQSRGAFCDEWHRLQQVKSLSGDSAGETNVNGVKFNGKQGREILRHQALVAYFEAGSRLKTLFEEFKKAQGSNDARSMAALSTEIDALQKTVDDLEQVIHFDGIKKCWDGCSATKIIKHIDATNDMFRKQAAAQKHVLGGALFTISSDIVVEPLQLRRELAVVRDQLNASRAPYRWSGHAHFMLGSTHTLPKDVANEFAARLKPGYVDLSSQDGRKSYYAYCQALSKAVARHGSKAGTIVINGQPYKAKEALGLLRVNAYLAYHEMAKRYLELDDKVREKIAADAELRALKIPKSVGELSQELNLKRREMERLKTEIPELARIAFSASTTKHWKKVDKHTQQVLLTSIKSNEQETDEIGPKLQRLFREKVPASSHEKRQALTAVQELSGQMAGQKEVDPRVLQAHRDNWEFIAQTCDIDNLDQLCEPGTFTQLMWALNDSPSVVLPLRPPAAERWLKSAMVRSAELVKAEWSHCDKVRKFAMFLSDPTFQKLIGDKDKAFVEETAKNLRESLRGAETLALAMDNALGVDMAQEDCGNMGIPSAVRDHLEEMTPIQAEAALLKMTNLFSHGDIASLNGSARSLLTRDFVEKWNAFTRKYQKQIQTYWNLPQNKAQRDDPRGPHASYQDMIYIPFQRRIGDYPLLWKSIKDDVPPQYFDAIEMTHLRTQARTKRVNMGL